ncbi:MAG: FtsX-like permease family protein [Leptospira sp.]|nr:FtsX-like permease family protein [Leptospira sp.]
MVKALNIKLIRDLNQLKFQALSIGCVILSGIAYLVGSWSSYSSLLNAKEKFYSEEKLMTSFANLNRAPNYISNKIANLHGVDIIETRNAEEVVLDFPNEIYPSSAHLVTLTEKLNLVKLQSGKMPEGDREVIVNESFALANQFVPGSTLVAIIAGNRTTLKISGIGLSPDFVYVFSPASIFPDNKHYGILWMNRDAIDEALDRKGTFNQIILKDSLPIEKKDILLKSIDEILKPYGGNSASDINKLPSASFLNDEFKQLRTTALFLPAIFLGVAAFLLHIVSSRLISKEREQIATLKALGYSNFTISIHYLKLISSITSISSLLGVFLGFYLGKVLTKLYGEYYRFPDLTVVYPIELVFIGLLIGLAFGAIGSFISLSEIVKLDPATAMKPPSPENFRLNLFEIYLPKISSQGKMIFRNLFKKPIRTTLTIIGLATSVMIMIIGSFIQDTVSFLLEIQFEKVQRESMNIIFRNPVNHNVIYEFMKMNGIMDIEGARIVPVKLKIKNKTKNSIIFGFPINSQLRRSVDLNNRITNIPFDGILLNETVAKNFNIKVGDKILIQILEGKQSEREVRVVNLVNEFIGQGIYMNRRELNKLLDEGDVINQIFVKIDTLSESDLIRDIKEMPTVASLLSKTGTLKAFKEILNRTLQSTSLVILLFTSIISIGVVFNTAMIVLSERTYELGSLRILGFSNREVFLILISEISVLVIISIPIGCLMGYKVSNYIINMNDTEGFKIPAIINFGTYFYSISLTIFTSGISFVMLFFKLKNLDLLSALKVRE